VLAVDLYRGSVTANRSEARKLKRERELPEERAIRDMKAAFDYLAGHADVDPGHIGALGWSMGGVPSRSSSRFMSRSSLLVS
jgi:dienelactone hydrolase